MDDRDWTVVFQTTAGGYGTWQGTAADIYQAIRLASHQWPGEEMIYAGLTGYQP